MKEKLKKLPWGLVIAAALTLGLAPFVPMPHVVEKLVMLFSGELTRPVDIFDLGMHGLPWLVLLAKGVATALPDAESTEG